jgi:hypothetical protein
MIFEAEASKALILADQGKHEVAKAAAHRALEAASIKAGWIPGYPNVGLVRHIPDLLNGRLERIAGVR